MPIQKKIGVYELLKMLNERDRVIYLLVKRLGGEAKLRLEEIDASCIIKWEGLIDGSYRISIK